MELIERAALKKMICVRCMHYGDCQKQGAELPTVCQAMKAVDAAPAVDAVPVVRCKDCVFSKPNDGKLVEGARYCSMKYDVAGLSYFDVWDNDYCSCGKRKEVQE